MIKQSASLKGSFEIFLVRDGVKVQALPPQENILLNSYFQSTVSSFTLHVGTGSATPQYTDTSLSNPLAQTATTDAELEEATYEQDGSILRTSQTLGFKWALGAVVGNLSEIGLGESSSTTSMVTKALIKDSGGNPTTVTVTAADELHVAYTLTMERDLSVIDSGTVNVKGVNIGYTFKPTLSSIASSCPSPYSGLGYANQNNLIYVLPGFLGVGATVNINPSDYTVTGDYTPASGYFTAKSGAAISNPSAGVLRRSIEWVVPTNQGNLNNIKYLVFSSQYNYILPSVTNGVIEFDTPFNKTAADILTFKIEVDYTRG